MGLVTAEVEDIFSLPQVISHFLTRPNNQWEIRGLTLARHQILQRVDSVENEYMKIHIFELRKKE